MEGTYSIDPAVYEDDDGTQYLYFGGIWGGQLQKYRDNRYDAAHEEPTGDAPALGPRVGRLDASMTRLAEPTREIIILDEHGRARERHKVHDGVATSEGGGECCWIRDVTDARRQARRMGDVALRDRRCSTRGSRERHDLMASLQERRENVTPDKARPTRKKDSRHFYPLLLLAQTL